MNYLEVGAKELLCLDKQKFHEKFVQNLPLIIKYQHQFINLAGVVLCAPRHHVWKFHAAAGSVFPDPLDEVGDEDIESSFKKELGAVDKNSLLFGLSHIADSFDYSRFDMDIGSMLQVVQVKADRVNDAVAYLSRWWDEFGSESLLHAEFGSVSEKWQAAEIRWKSEYISILLKDAWSVSINNEGVARCLDRFRAEIVPDIDRSQLHLDAWVERFGAYPGKVNRDILMPLKPNKRLVPIDPGKVEIVDIGLRDEFFSIQCAAVRSLQRPSMYYRAREAYFDYQKSIDLKPVNVVTSFDWKLELETYMKDMQDKYPFFAEYYDFK